MNHAVAVVNGYLHHYSRTMRRVRKRRDYARDVEDEKQVGHLLFAIFDCRHMALEGFWDSIVPQFYRYVNPNNPWSAELEINPKVAFVQLPQTFTGLSIREDFFDMRNEYLFRMANTVRTGVGAITSCGTNAVWNYPLHDAIGAQIQRGDDDRGHGVVARGYCGGPEGRLPLQEVSSGREEGHGGLRGGRLPLVERGRAALVDVVLVPAASLPLPVAGPVLRRRPHNGHGHLLPSHKVGPLPPDEVLGSGPT